MRTLIPTLVLFLLVSQTNGQVERDKALHYLGGNLFGLAGAGIAKQASDGNRVWTFAGALVGATAIGLAKEAVDAGQRKDGWDNDDLAATVLGGLTIGVTIEVFSKKRDKRRPMGSLTTDNYQLRSKDFQQEIDYQFYGDDLPTLTSLGFTTAVLSSTETTFYLE